MAERPRSTAKRAGGGGARPSLRPPPRRGTRPPGARRRLELDPDKIQRDVIRLVLTLVELIRQLLLRQAIRRLESGTLEEDRIEALGLAMLRLEETMVELKRHFRFTDDDLNADLGPLGKLY